MSHPLHLFLDRAVTLIQVSAISKVPFFAHPPTPRKQYHLMSWNSLNLLNFLSRTELIQQQTPSTSDVIVLEVLPYAIFLNKRFLGRPAFGICGSAVYFMVVPVIQTGDIYPDRDLLMHSLPLIWFGNR